MGITYDVVHRTEYRYGAPVSLSQQLLHLAPRDTPRQARLAHALVVDPAPSRRVDGEDAFGNPLTRLDFDRPHDTLAITARLRVRVEAGAAFDPLESPAWEDVVAALAYRGGEALDEAHLEAMRYRVESPYVRIKTVFADYARPCFTPGRPLLDAAQALMQAIHADFTYSPEATQIATPLLDVFEKRHGVCQDFAHVMLACLRSLGLSARYVSGYLRTTPVEGKPRLVGADASHAWVSVFCPRQGWVDFDPTNRVVPSLQHVTLAAGRDFGDVSPLRGVILGGGAHELEVAVMVMPVEPADA